MATGFSMDNVALSCVVMTHAASLVYDFRPAPAGGSDNRRLALTALHDFDSTVVNRQ